ncbi:MAG: response regulator transcription factor [Hyphomicrobiaceae bacterium]|nr:response regulator transcription factor [Hyphomicrobiaceae bacterium]
MKNDARLQDVKIAVIDDHPIFRAGVVQVLNAEVGFSVVGEGSSAEDATRIAVESKPDVMLLDVSMPGGGLEAVRTIAAEVPHTRVLMLTVVAEETFVLSALGAGARGYILKGISGRALVRTIWSLRNGDAEDCYVNVGLGDRLPIGREKSSSWGGAVVARRLSAVDRRILGLATDGRSDADIARSLGLEAGVVELRLASMTQLVRMGSLQGRPALNPCLKLH